jgi:hypothetical protein
MDPLHDPAYPIRFSLVTISRITADLQRAGIRRVRKSSRHWIREMR